MSRSRQYPIEAMAHPRLLRWSSAFWQITPSLTESLVPSLEQASGICLYLNVDKVEFVVF